MRYGVLGATQVWRDDGAEAAVGGPRLRALLARLLLDPGRPVGTARLLADLYGEDLPAGAGNALQSQVSRLRRVAPVAFQPAGYRLDVDPDEVDLHRFGRLAEEGRRELAAGDPAAAEAALTAGLELWRGPALADLTAPFADRHRPRLAELRLAAVQDRAAARLALGRPAEVLPELRQLLAEQPVREPWWALLMRALVAAGRPAEALTAYEQARRNLADELGVDPSPELAALHREVLRAGPPPAAPEPSPTRAVPAQLTSFIGREPELAQLDRLLAESRLVSVIGPGGAGKTRLALAAAARSDLEVHYVELAAVASGDDLPPVVLGALGLREAGLREPGERRDPTARLVAALADRRVLLVLDNCEHVITGAAALTARLLAACPGLRILTTSREPLRLTGEALCRIAGLPLPAPGATPAVVREAAAIRLFTARAAESVPGFALDDDLDAVLRICRTLDGLPLAIELAAARLRALPVAEVASRLDDRFRLLSRGSRATAHRHQTLRAVVDWSWELLDPAEQTLARRFAVFVGGADLAAVSGVCGVPDDDAVEVLASLVDKSLVELTGSRYRMLETIHAYCVERLEAAGEAERLRRAHAGYFLELAQRAAGRLRTADQLTWLDQLDAERDNLHAAIRRCVDDDPAVGVRLVSALSFYWWLRGLRGEGGALAAALLSRLPVGGPSELAEEYLELAEEYLLCQLNAAIAGLAPPEHTPDPGTVRGLLRGDRPPRQPFLLYLSALAAGPPVDSVTDYADLISRSGAVLDGDPWSMALAPVGTGLVHQFVGDLVAADRELTVAVERFGELGERWGTMIAVAARAEVAGFDGGPELAAELMGEAVRLADELGSRTDMAELLRTRAETALRGDDLAAAEADLRRSLELAQRAGAPELVAGARSGLAEVARRRGDLAAARELAQRGLADCRGDWFSAEEARSSLELVLGRVAETEGRPELAREHYQRVVAGTGREQSLFTSDEAVAALARLA